MPHPVPLPLRQVIQKRFSQGHGVAAIAREFGLIPRTVRHLIRRFRDQGEDAIPPSYPHREQRQNSPAALDYLETALQLRRDHPTWGAGLIRVYLRRDYPQKTLPAERTLQRWFKRAGLAPVPSGRRPIAQPQRAQHPHEVWQMDAAEFVRLKSGKQVCWCRIVDECSGAVLETAVFPPGALEQRSCRRSAVFLTQDFPALGTSSAVPC